MAIMKTFLKHPIVAGTITFFISTAITTPLIMYFKSISFIQAVKTLANFLWWIFTFGVPAWIIILLIFVVILTRKILVKLSKAQIFGPITYKSDLIDWNTVGVGMDKNIWGISI